MGLDWKPMNKPKAGLEKEYEDIFFMLSGKKAQKTSLVSKLFGNKEISREKLLERFFEISIQPYETLKAPRVGIDDKATEWAKSKFDLRTDKNQNLIEFLRSMHGYYVVDLVPENDGIPMYIALHDEPHIFRGQFLNDVVGIIRESMLEEACTSQLATGAVDFGQRLMRKADDYATKYNLMYLKDQRMSPEDGEDTPQGNAHVLFSAAKWLLWWGQRGHGYEADF